MELQTFPELTKAGLPHGFSTRSSRPLAELESELSATFNSAGFPIEKAVQAEQPHGNRVAAVTGPVAGRVPEVDALVTDRPGLPLVIRVADCGPVYFYDPIHRAIGLAHSGRRGTEGNIVGATIACLAENFGSDPADLLVQLGPCIRPPHYEIDFAAEIGRQARAAGVRNFFDEGICTASRLDRYYSYRAEQGKTGRMWAVLMLPEGHAQHLY